MNAITTRTAMFASRREEWPSARRFIESFCEEAQVPEPARLKCEGTVDKLFAATAEHARKAGVEVPIWITLSASDGELTLTYEDRAPPANPFPGDRAVRYAYLFGRNRVQLVVA